MTRPRLRPLLFVVLLLVLTAGAAVRAHAQPLNVIATTGMLADAVREVGGERVDVNALMGAGVDPHTYRQTRTDITRLARADLIVWHGMRLEAQLEKLLTDLSRRQPVHALAEAIPAERLLASEDYPDQPDPHVWMDPVLWTVVVEAARDVLTQIDPEGGEHYAENARAYAAQIAEMNARVQAQLAEVAPEDRVLVTAHDAFRYFGRANDFEVLGIQGISTESEASLSQIEHLVGVLVERGIPAVFVESSVSDRNLRALAEGAAARGHVVAIGGELYSDAMGPPGTPAGTYLGMIEHNAATIAKALRRAS